MLDHQGESEARPADAVARCGAPGEALEDPHPLAEGDTGSGVLDGDEHVRSLARLDRDAQRAAAVVIGADPGTILAAVTPVPETLSEYQFAGLMRGAKAELVACKTVPLMVPAQAEPSSSSAVVPSR